MNPIKLALIAEFDSSVTTPEAARAKLDAFREAVLPSINYGLTIYSQDGMSAVLEALRATQAALQDAREQYQGETCPEAWDYAEDNARIVLAQYDARKDDPKYSGTIVPAHDVEIIKMTDRERATVVAALRRWQRARRDSQAPQEPPSPRADKESIKKIVHELAFLHRHDALDDAEIDALCETVMPSSEYGITLYEADAPKDHTTHQAFIARIARMTQDGETREDGSEFIMENDDAVSTVNDLISSARALLADPPTPA